MDKIKICHIIARICVVKEGTIKATELQNKGRHKSGEGGIFSFKIDNSL